jgi:type I restriction enzyme S subunit
VTGLPAGWTNTTLGELGRYHNGRGFKKSEWSKSGRPIVRIQNLTGSGGAFNYFDGLAEERHIVREGDLLISWAATLGSFIWRGPEGVVNQHIFKVQSNINPKFHHYLIDYALNDLRRKTHGSGIVHITRPVFDSFKVPLPSIADQERIAGVLDEYGSRLNAADQYLIAAKMRSRALSNAQEALSVSGAPIVTLEELLAEPLRNGHSASASVAGKIRTLTLTAVTAGKFIDRFSKLTAADPHKVRNLWLRSGDILVQRSNTPDLVGSSALYEGPDNWAIFPDLLIRVRVNHSRVRPEYVAAVLAGTASRARFRGLAKGLAGSMPKIDQAAIAGTPIPLPPFEEQDRIVAELSAWKSEYRAVSSSLAAAERRGLSLRRSLLDAAFSGRL